MRSFYVKLITVINWEEMQRTLEFSAQYEKTALFYSIGNASKHAGILSKWVYITQTCEGWGIFFNFIAKLIILFHGGKVSISREEDVT